MRISHEHKFAYIAIPRTGSTTVRNALNEFSDISSDIDFSFVCHMSANNLRERFIKEKWEWNDYFKFSFVRNPWELHLSLWFYVIKSAAREIIENPTPQGNHRNKHSISCRKALEKFSDFNSFVVGRRKLVTCNNFLFDNKGNLIVDFVGRQESLQVDFDKVCDSVSIPRKKLVVNNTTKHAHYSTYYNKESRDYIAESCKKEIEMFGYEFGKES